jgi:hypothetical protein
MMNITQEPPQGTEQAKFSNEKKRGEKERWGPILVELRPSRGVKDGRTVLERAQDRKKKVNLEEPKGINHNPSPTLSSEDITAIANIAVGTGVVLGRDLGENEKTLLEIIENDHDRKSPFEKVCPECQVKTETVGVNIDGKGEQGDDALCTPKNQSIRPQMGELSDGKGQWTLIANKKKSKPKVPP